MSRSSSLDERINRLHSLTETLDHDNNKRDKTCMMSQLSQEFDIHMKKAERCVKDKDLGGAEAHRLKAESIHRALATFEAVKE
jgi:hypothetical protein